MTRPGRRNLAIYLGAILVLAGVSLSGNVLESTIFPAGTIVGTERRAAALVLGRILLAGAGAYLLVRRPRVTTVHLAAFALAGLVFGLFGALCLQVGYTPPRVVSGWKSTVPPAERNELGFRGRGIAFSPDDYVVVLLGDSQVEATALAFDAMPERRLEAHLGSSKARVFSIGTGGYGQDQELLALQEYFAKYRADLVVLWQTPGNDVWNNVFKTHMANRNPKPTFWLDDAGQLQGPSEGLLQPLGDSGIVVAALWARAFGLPWRDKRWERGLPAPYAPLVHHAGPTRGEWQERWNTNLGRMRDENLDTEKSHLAIMLEPRSRRMQYGLDLTRALMRRIQELVAAHGGRLVVFYADPHESASEGSQVYVLNNKYYRVSRRQYEENWSYVNRDFDAESIPVTAPEWRVGAEDGHLNARATDQVMADLATRLRSRIAAKSTATAGLR